MAQVLHTLPPNYSAVVAVFPSARRTGTIFSYYPNIHFTGRGDLPPELIAHEEVHLRRQQEQTVEVWWDKYLTDPSFRYNEELLAHQAEYQYLMINAESRQVRRSALKRVASRLASPLYGRVVTLKKAMADISE